VIGATLLGGLLPLCGCGNQNEEVPYPESLRYGLRTDLLVKGDKTKTPPPRLDSPGQYLETLAGAVANGAEAVNPDKLSAKDRSEIESALYKTFGTPAQPKVEGLEPDAIEELHLQPEHLAEGSMLFRRHCLHCHGLTGNGQGPTGTWVNPHPRDYRRGIFKFTSSKQPSGSRKPRREDLVRTVTQGIEGTSMPAFSAQSSSKFGLLHDDEIDKLVSYVIHLSLRGEVEFDTIWYHDNLQVDDQPASPAEFVADRLKTLTGYWTKARDEPIKPGDYTVKEDDPKAMTESIKQGYELFMAPTAVGCIKCHMDFGRRNNFLYDAWGTIVKPRDLTEGIFRGGRRPIDLYWRISGGVNGAGMPDASGTLKPDQIWHIVNFVKALPYPAMLPNDAPTRIRDKVYPDLAKSSHGSEAAFVPDGLALKPAAQE
jgi:mono/diheme cytochrome c family protein